MVISPKFKSWWVLWIHVNLWFHHAPILNSSPTYLGLYNFDEIVNSSWRIHFNHISKFLHNPSCSSAWNKEHAQGFQYFLQYIVLRSLLEYIVTSLWEHIKNEFFFFFFFLKLFKKNYLDITQEDDDMFIGFFTINWFMATH
jgi:hypothetical protein